MSTMAFSGCVTQNQKGEPLSLTDSAKATFKGAFNNDDPCSNNARNIGIALGAVGGAVLASQLGGNNKQIATVVGMAAGAGVGGLIGASLDKRRCELSKIQKKYALEMQITPIEAQTGNIKENVGLSVAVVDQAGRPQFQSGSSVLQSGAKEHFTEIAQQYSIEQTVTQSGATSKEEKSQVNDAWHKKRILLIGHTDDTGSSKLNAELSERRAREVAQIFKAAGVGESQLYYQGAGETLPIADNATAEGRAKNRRVEIVDLSNEENFKLYLQNRRPNTAYYRPAEATSAVTKIAKNSKHDSAESKTKARNKYPAEKPIKLAKSDSQALTSQSAPIHPQLISDYIDFGGSDVTPTNTTIQLGKLAKHKSTSWLISEAQADDLGAITSCDKDRPRNSGVVKSLKDGKAYATSDYLPGLYGRSWQDTVNGNLIVLNDVAVLRDGATAANAPSLKVYANYNPGKNRNPKPDVAMNPVVNTYQGSNGLLYRVFTQNEQGMRCMDVLMPVDGSSTAKEGKVLYVHHGSEFVANFKPIMIN